MAKATAHPDRRLISSRVLSIPPQSNQKDTKVHPLLHRISRQFVLAVPLAARSTSARPTAVR